MYIKKDLKKYLDDLASGRSVPGGGSASALACALGTALSSMVSNFTVPAGKNTRGISSLQKENESLRRKVQVLIDKDVVVFLRLQDAFKLPRTSPQRPVLLEKSLKESAAVPFEVCRLASQAITLCARISGTGKPALLPDAGCAVYLLDAAFKAAEINVRINLKYIRDRKFYNAKIKALQKMSAGNEKNKLIVIKKVKEVL